VEPISRDVHSISRSALIAVALFIVVVILILYTVALTIENSRLRSEIYRLQELKSKYDSLSSDYDVLLSAYDELKGSYNQLLEVYNQLQNMYESLKVEYESKVGELEQLKKEYEELSRKLLIVQIPNGYYDVNFIPDRNGTLENVYNFLMWEFTMPRGYVGGTFDCSEMAAYLEWVLEDAGFDAKIAVGPCPWDPSLGYHAWVIVYTQDGYMVAIEPTVLMTKDDPLYIKIMRAIGVYLKEHPIYSKAGIVYAENPYANGYYKGYTALYDTIYDAVVSYRDVSEWDWWLGYWGFSR